LAAGMPQQRSVPAFAPQTFRAWFDLRTAARRTTEHHKPANSDGTLVMLWPDTFNNYFLPDTAKAAVEVLEASGFRVFLPESILCCGRPLYDFGMLDRAKRLLRKVL